MQYEILTIKDVDEWGQVSFIETGTGTGHHDFKGAKPGDKYKVYCDFHPIQAGSMTLKAEKL